MPKNSANAIDRHICNRVNRIMLTISQTTLGDGLGVGFQQAQKYEKGTNPIGASGLEHMARGV